MSAHEIENKNRTEEEAKSVAVAEESRELDWKSKSFMASMYMGDLDLSMAYPFPEQSPEDKAEGDAIVAKVAAFASRHIDGDAIDRAEKIPAGVLKGLADLGLFGIKIPKKYGGLGLSQTNYLRILSELGKHCGSVAATLSAHQSIGVPQPLKLFGTEEQKQKYLPRVAKGAVTAFGLTEPSVGSDPANMETQAELSEDGTHWILNGRKLWCTNGVIADLIVVMARTPDKVIKGKPRKQITAFIVEADWEGVEVLHRCRFMGIRAIENGLISFKNVKVPAENVIAGEGQGLKLALTTLNDGRMGIPSIAAAGVEEIAQVAASWGKTRVQWGKAVGEHEAGAAKLAYISSSGYAMDTLARYGSALSDRGDVDIRMEAATAKLFNTELSWDVIDTALQFRGGRGFETRPSLEERGDTAFPMERALRDARINRIVEGTTDIMHLFLAREALDKHLRTAGVLLSKAPTGTKLKALPGVAWFYTTWLIGLLFGGWFRSFAGFDARLARHLRFADRQTRRMARKLFVQMALQGPKLEMRQLTLARIVDLGAELAVMALVASRAQTELNRGDKSNLTRALYWLDLAQIRVKTLFRELSENTDKAANKLARELMEAAEPLATPEPVEFTPLPRERGSDLTSGRLARRVGEPDSPTAGSEARSA